MPPPLSLSSRYLNIVASGGRRQNPTKDNGAPLSVIKMLIIVASGKGGALAALKTHRKKTLTLPPPPKNFNPHEKTSPTENVSTTIKNKKNPLP